MGRFKRIIKGVGVKNSPSLYISLLYAIIIGLVVSILLSVTSNFLANNLIKRHYLSEEESLDRELEYVKDLQSYITANELSSEDTDAIARWVRNNKYLYVMIYKDDQLIIDSDYKGEEEDTPNENPDNKEEEETEEDTEKNEEFGGGITVEFPTREDLIKYASEKDSHLIEVSDGHILASMVDFTEYLYYDIVNIASIVLAAAVFIAIVMLYFRTVMKRLTGLAKEVTTVAEGDMTHSINPEGKDEIARLGRDVDNMRSAILMNLEKEKAALSANAELITSMSHDIRTPLTVLLGYIDIMKECKEEGAMQEYVRASEHMALRLKKLSDDMFNYFLVFGGGVKLNLDKYNAATLLEQMLSEHLLLLKERGYLLNFENKCECEISKRTITTDANQMMRMIENVFSNILKYSDKCAPVSVLQEITGKEDELKIKLLFTNSVCRNEQRVESNGIGLKTCEKIAEALGIGFKTEDGDGKFSVEIEIPIQAQ